MEKEVKQTVGTVGERHTNDEEIAYINALKAVDFEKEYKQALRDLAETMFDMEFDEFGNPKGNYNNENNEPILNMDAEH